MFIYIFPIITVAWTVNVAKTRKIIYNKVALSRKKPDNFNLLWELRMGNFSRYRAQISTTLSGLVSMWLCTTASSVVMLLAQYYICGFWVMEIWSYRVHSNILGIRSIWKKVYLNTKKTGWFWNWRSWLGNITG